MVLRECLLLAGLAFLASAESLDEYLTMLARDQWTARAKTVAAITTPAQVRERQEYVRSFLMNAIGPLPPRTPLNPRITGTLQRSGYRIEKLIFESQPKFYVTASVFVPEGPGPFPAVVGVAGHSDTGKAIDTYQHAWISMAKRGILVLAFDPAGQGERLQYLNPATGKSAIGVGVREHIQDGLLTLLTGSAYARYEIWDGMRAVDYLLTRDDVDPKKLGVAGNSGGGTQSAYLAAMEPRLAAAVASCYITSWETLWSGPGPQDAEQIFPGFLKAGLDFPDFLLAFAPKPILMTTAIQDYFPIAGARATYAEAKRLFEVADAPGRAGYFEFDDKHGWSQPRREAAYRWFATHLQGREGDDGREPVHQTEPPVLLNATTTGQVSSMFPDAETVRTLNLKVAEQQYASRRALTEPPRSMRERVARTIGVDRPGPQTGELKVPHNYVRPEGYTRVLLWIDSSVPPDSVEPGTAVLTIDPVGMGAAAFPKSPGDGYTPEYQAAMRALLVGRTLLGLQVNDALEALTWLRSRVDVPRIQVGGGTPQARAVALVAGALAPVATGYLNNGPVPSWMEIVRAKQHHASPALIVPAVLREFDLPDLLKLATTVD